MLVDVVAIGDTGGSEYSAGPPWSVCFTWVPLAMYWIGLSCAGAVLGPTARKVYRAV